MKKMKTYFASLVCLCLLSGVLPSCTKEIGGAEDEPEIIVPPVDEDPQLEAISIRIGAAETAETKAMHGDENAVEGEFIHSLHLFIVGHDTENIDTIAKHITVTPDSEELTADQKAEAAIGNLPQYSTTIDILPGSYTFYAFANMEHAKTGTENASVDELLSKMTEGSEWLGIDDLVINDPAAAVDINNADEENRKYIPMSVKQDVELTVDGQRISLSLVRLVSKIKTALQNNQGADVKVIEIAYSGFASNVSLFPNVSEGVDTEKKTTVTKVLGLTAQNNKLTDLPEIYVNETLDSQYTVQLTVEEGTGNEATYAGSLNVTTIDIPRNNVKPVRLSLATSDVVFEIEAWIAPIGGYPVPIMVGNNGIVEGSEEEEAYQATVPEGCTFSINAYLWNNTTSTKRDILAWTWTNSSADDNLIEFDASLPTGNEQGDEAVSPITGRVVALKDQKITLQYQIMRPILLSPNNLIMTTVPLKDWDEYQLSTRSLTQWGEAPRWYEAVRLVKRPSALGFNPEP